MPPHLQPYNIYKYYIFTCVCIYVQLGNVLLLCCLHTEILFHFFITSQKSERDPHHGCRGLLHEERYAVEPLDMIINMHNVVLGCLK